MSNTLALAALEPAASRVRDPLTGRSVWLAGLIIDARAVDKQLTFTLLCKPGHSPADREQMRTAIVKNLSKFWSGSVVCSIKVEASKVTPPKKDPVRGMSGPGMKAHGGPIEKHPIPGVAHIVAVASGKGGVGKSTVSTNLAISLASQGKRVGLMDADVYGPSLPTMMNVSGKPIANEKREIVPLEAYGVKCMSVGFMINDDEPIIWRGPMVMGLVRQFLQQVAWGELDVLVVDLPPGTGDAQLTMIQAVPISGSVIVTTPQDVSVLDAVRGIEMFQRLDVPILGVVENMSWLALPDGSRIHPFGEGGGEQTAQRYNVPLIAQIPLDGQIREGGDLGKPVALGTGPQSEPFHKVATAVCEALLDTTES